MITGSVIRGLFLATLLLTPAVSIAAEQGPLQGLRMGVADGVTRLVIRVPSPTPFTIDESADGTLIRIDLADLMPPEKRLMTRRVGLVERTALSQHSGGLRLALGLAKAGRVLAAKPTVDAQGRHGIAIDLVTRAWQPQSPIDRIAFTEHASLPTPDITVRPPATAWTAAITPAGAHQDEAIAAWLWSTHADRQVFALAPAGTEPVPVPIRVETADAAN